MKIKRINKDVLKFIFLITFQSFITPQILSAQNNEIDSLENIVNRSEEDSTKAYALREIAVLLEYSNPDSAFYLCGKALNLLRKNNPEQTDNNSSEFISPGIAANIYNTMGVTNWIKSDFPSALEYYFDALKLREALNDNRSISNIYNNIGVVYWDLSDYANALEYFFKSLEIRLTLGSKKNIAGSYNNIAGIYNNQKRYSEALAYYRKSLEIRKELGNKKKLSQSYTNIGILYNSVYEQRDSLVSTLKNWEIDDPVELLDSAMFYQKMALTIDKEISYDYGALFDNLAIASIYIEKSQFHKAIGYYKKSIPIADSLHALKQASELHGGLSTCYKNIGNYKLALEHHELYVEFKDKVFSAEKSKEIGKLEAKHELQVAELKKKREEEEDARVLAEKTYRRNLLQDSGVLIFIVVFFILLLFSAKLEIPANIIEGGVFFTFLLVFEFILVLVDPYVEQYTGGAPAFKLIANAVFAVLIIPLHRIAEIQLKKRLLSFGSKS